MNYDLFCIGTFNENNIRCDKCQDKTKCSIETILKEKEKEENKNE